MNEFSIIAVFAVGLLGGVHCIGMCGSIVGILTSQLPSQGARWPFHLVYNIGRITSYTVAGGLVGAIGQAGFMWRDQVPVQQILFALSSSMLILLGLYLAGIWGLVRRFEHAGGLLWRHIQPFAFRLLPITTLRRALFLGALWGWLPCGLVYSVLVTALSSGNPKDGALIMLAFGAGTLFNLLVIGLFWDRCRYWVQSSRVRLTAGLIVMTIGAYGLTKVAYVFAVNGWSGSCHVPV
jgi:sulfite exporter TauE/SafE